MSRGLGALQKKILVALADERLYSILEIAAKTHGPTVTAAEYESLRRAVHSLEKRELIADTWWYVAFAENPPRRYGLPHIIDRTGECFLNFMERRYAGAKVLDAASTQCLTESISVVLAAGPTLGADSETAAP
jgi:hypothetical protein